MKKSFLLMLAILWMAIIWIISSIPSKDLPSFSMFGIDKLAHFGVYFVWGILVNLYLKTCGAGKKVYWIVYLMMLIAAALDEYHQKYIPGRSVTVYDFMANAAGLLSAYAARRYAGSNESRDQG